MRKCPTHIVRTTIIFELSQWKSIINEGPALMAIFRFEKREMKAYCCWKYKN